MAVYFNKKKKPLFHKPQKVGEVVPVPMNLPMKILSIVGLVLLAGLIALSIYGFTQHNGGTLMLAEGFGMPSGMVFLFLPIVGIILCLGFRFAVKVIPLEMWRLPKTVKESAQKTKGKWLKFCTLCLEVETTLVFLFITYVLIQGHMPGDIPIILWVVVVILTIIFFGRWDIVEASKIRD